MGGLGTFLHLRKLELGLCQKIVDASCIIPADIVNLSKVLALDSQLARRLLPGGDGRLT
jgi:hypothetical protein